MRNWRLRFRGGHGSAVATVERHKGSGVPVLVWELQTADEAALDVYEGWPRLYRKETVRVRLDGKQVRAMIYLMNAGYPYGRPSADYYKIIRGGYADAGFDLETLRDAVRQSIEEGGDSMNQKIREQILTVRDTGETNMFDVDAVQRIAMREGFYELVCWLEEHRREYSRFILTGKTDKYDGENEK
jgi:hypothetical protein